MTDRKSDSKTEEDGPRIPGSAPPFNTGGGGFVVEKQAGARALLSLLSGISLPGIELGAISTVRLQARGDGWLLDDLLVTSESSGVTRRCSISVKSGDEFGTTSAPASFVRLAWAQLLAIEPKLAAFNEQQDFLCLACPFPETELKRQLTELIAKAGVQGPEQLERHMQSEDVAALGKELYGSFRCPDELAQGKPTDQLLPGRLLRLLRFWGIDFREVGSSSRAESLAVCADLLLDPPESKEGLWEAVCDLADRLRPRSGTVDLNGVLSFLRGRFHLRPHPDYRDDFQRLADSTRERLARVRDTIGNKMGVTGFPRSLK